MPHLVMEYSDPVAERVNVDHLLDDLHKVTLDSGLFAADDVKSRAYPCHRWLVGEQDNQADFIHLELSLLDGRSMEEKNDVSRALLYVLEHHAADVASLTVDIRDMERGCFSKISRPGKG